MADETQVPPHRAGASKTAPTAPHATPPDDGDRRPRGRRTGPERFWSRWPARIALAASLVVSAAVHWGVSPWSLLPSASLEIKDADGELTIPIDLFTEDEPTPAAVAKAAEPSSPTVPAGADVKAGPGADAGPKPRDASADRDLPDAHAEDAGARDARARDAADEAGGRNDDAGLLAAADAEAEGGAIASSSDGGDGDSGALAKVDEAGVTGPGGGRDPTALLGAAGQLHAGVQNVDLLLNMAEVRKNTVGAALGPLITAIPQWSDFLAGSKVDPVQHTDWLRLNGPSLAHTERDLVIVRYSIDDIWVDAAIDRISKRSPDGRSVDAGVPGVKVTLGFGDRAKRAFVRPQPHLLAVAPPDYAVVVARTLKSMGNPRLPAGQAVVFIANKPHESITEVPAEVNKLTVRVMLAANDGVDIFGEGECSDSDAADKAAAQLSDFLRRANAIGVKLVTRGVLNNAEIHSDGKRVLVHIPVSREQLDALYALGAGLLGVNVPPPAAPSALPR